MQRARNNIELKNFAVLRDGTSKSQNKRLLAFVSPHYYFNLPRAYGNRIHTSHNQANKRPLQYLIMVLLCDVIFQAARPSFVLNLLRGKRGKQ